MNIVMFSDAYLPRINGVSISVQSFAKELVKKGHSVCVVCAEYPYDQSFSLSSDGEAHPSMEDDSIKVIRIPSMKVVFSKEDRLARFDKWFFVKKQMDKFKPDIVHINSELMVGYYGAMYARHRHIAMVFTFHTMWEDYVKGYLPVVPSAVSKHFIREHMRFYLRYATEIIAPTAEIKQVVSEYGIDRNVHLLPTGISSSFFKMNDRKKNMIQSILEKEIPSLKEKKILLFVGRIAKEKNTDFLLDVMEKIKDDNPDTVLLFVGDGPYLNDLKRHTAKRNLEDKVFFTGYMNRSDLPYVYSLAKVFTFPSKTETQGLVTAESMLSNTPVVAIGERGTINVMQGDNGGYMVADDVAEFSAKTSLLLQDKDLYESKTKEAFEWGKKWTIESMTPKLLSIYETAKEKMKGKNKKW